MATRETENNSYAKFWSDEQRTLWYLMVFSIVVNWCNDEYIALDRYIIKRKKRKLTAQRVMVASQ